MAAAAGQAAWPVVQNVRGRLRERRTYTVKISGDDELYDDIHEWVLTFMPPAERHALIAYSPSRMLSARFPVVFDSDVTDSGVYLPDNAADEAQALRLRYDGTYEQVVRIGRARVRISVMSGEHHAESAEGGYWKPPQITFAMSSGTDRDIVLAHLGQLLVRSRTVSRIPRFMVANAHGGSWTHIDDMPERPLASVVLPPGQLDRIVADAERFMKAEHEYVRRGIPWHRCHLYTGPPGTGKTSVARALASSFRLNMWYLPLGDMKYDSDLVRMISLVGPRSMLLLEDIDVFHAAKARDDTAPGATLSGLLNALDGIATPHGLFTVMTTNEAGVVDPALIRPGRVDLTEEFAPCDSVQAYRILSYFYDHPVPEKGMAGHLTPAAVMEICKRHDRWQDAAAELQGGNRGHDYW